MDKKATLVLFTGSFPYYKMAENTFLGPELDYLLANFNEVIVVPSIVKGSRQEMSNDIEVEEGYAKEVYHHSIFKKYWTMLLALTSSIFYKELLLKPKVLIYRRKLLRLIRFVAVAERTKMWITTYLEKNNFNLKGTVIYTYWLNAITLGVGLSIRNYTNIKLVSRAHGIDLYEERTQYIPCRRETLRVLDTLFLISENGKNYITNKYPDIKISYQVSRLGVGDPHFFSRHSEDGIFRIVSCSNLVPVKRVKLLFRGIVELSKLHDKKEIEWYHIGDGPLKDQVQKLCSQMVGTNLKCNLLGHLPNDEVMSFYKKTPIDVFINVSSSEGIPVTIMEAQSCAIPVIGTAVGGIPEIVSDKVGKLLSPDPSLGEIADAIGFFIRNSEIVKEIRKASKSMWQERYDADKNYALFATSLKRLIM